MKASLFAGIGVERARHFVAQRIGNTILGEFRSQHLEVFDAEVLDDVVLPELPDERGTDRVIVGKSTSGCVAGVALLLLSSQEAIAEFLAHEAMVRRPRG